MELQDVDGALFRKVLDLWCGKGLETNADVEILLKLGSVADRFQVTEVAGALEGTIFHR